MAGNAIAYLHAQQNSDGGFTFSAPGPSDPDSDALVIQALVALGQDPSGAIWTDGGKTVFDDLDRVRQPTADSHSRGNPGPDAFTTSQCRPLQAGPVAGHHDVGGRRKHPRGELPGPRADREPGAEDHAADDVHRGCACPRQR